MHVAIFGVLCVCMCWRPLHGQKIVVSFLLLFVCVGSKAWLLLQTGKQTQDNVEAQLTIDMPDTFLRRRTPAFPRSTHAGLTYSGTGFRRLLQTKLQPSYKSEEYDQQIVPSTHVLVLCISATALVLT